MVPAGDGDELDEQDVLSAAHEKIAQLQVGLENRGMIGAAVGILMERYKLDMDGAWAALTRASMSTNIKVSELAQQLTSTGTAAGL